MHRHIHRGLWITAGSFFVVLGIIGLLPVIPAVPFFFLAIICFMRCSKRFNDWMEQKAWFTRLRARLHNLFHPWH